MKSTTLSCCIGGTSAQLVHVESTFTSGFAGIQVVGNSREACREGKERAKAALERLGLKLAHKRILINLAPASPSKLSNHFDLPMAVSLACLHREDSLQNEPCNWLFAAELGVDGALRPCRALVSMALCALQHGLKGLVLSHEHTKDHRLLQTLAPFRHHLQFLYFSHLGEILSWIFEGIHPSAPEIQPAKISPDTHPPTPNFDDMLLDQSLENLALATIIGRHNLLLRGSPGSGKSMFVHRLRSLLPPLSEAHTLEVLDIYSRLHEHIPTDLVDGSAPYRYPHHSSSLSAMLGNERDPGELSLAHGGLLFLDELPEFRRDLLEALREPLELGFVQVARANGKVKWPADIQLIAACNNCPCGWFGSKYRLCRCNFSRIRNYQLKLSGPLLDRIDIHFLMPERKDLGVNTKSHCDRTHQTQRLIKKIEDIRSFQAERGRLLLGGTSNSSIANQQLFALSGCSEGEYQRLLTILEKLKFTTRSLVQTMQVARSLADVRLSFKVEETDVLLASQWHHSHVAAEFEQIYELH